LKQALKTVGLIAVPLHLAKLRLKNHEKICIFDQNLNPKNNIFDQNLNPKNIYPLIKNAKMGHKINVPKKDRDRIKASCSKQSVFYEASCSKQSVFLLYALI